MSESNLKLVGLAVTVTLVTIGVALAAAGAFVPGAIVAPL